MLWLRILSIFVLLFTFPSHGKKTIVLSVSKSEMRLLKKMDMKYQKEHGIHMKLGKRVVSSIMGTEKTSEGEIWIDSGKMHLNIAKPNSSKIVADGTFLWIETPSPAGFENSAPQVLKASLKSEQAKSQGLIQILTQGGLLKYFKVSGVQRLKTDLIFFLQPNNQAVEFKRAQIEVNAKDKTIRKLVYWDQMDNETEYSFSDIKFGKKIAKTQFEYIPPAKAKVIHY